jgi:hypothetical protein
MRRFTLVVSVVAGTLLTTPLLAQTKTDADYLAIGRKYAEWFLNGQGDSLVAHSDEANQNKAKASDFVDRRDQVAARIGNETSVVEEKMNRRKGNRQYWRESTYDNLPEPFVLRFLLNDGGDIIGVGMGPKSQTPAPD